MKGVSEGKINDAFVGLISKMYSMKNVDSKRSNTAKGVYIGTELNEFKDILFNIKGFEHRIKRIQSKKYKFGTYEVNKTCFYDKRFVLDDGIHTLA